MNKFLEGRGFTTPALKTCAAGLMLCMGAGSLVGLAGLAMFFIFAPVVSSVFAALFIGLYLYFNFTGYVCPLCDTHLDMDDGYEMDGGGYCHEWCAHMLETKK